MIFSLLLVFHILSFVRAGLCPEGTTYESKFNKCYKYYSQAMSFLAAERTCEQNGGNLVSIVNAFENSYVSGFVAGSTKVETYWIGASLLLSSSWSWTSGQSYNYQNWAGSQPLDPSMYQCASARDVDYQWTKELCGSSRPFVCQIDLSGSNPSFCSKNPSTVPYPTPTPTSHSGCPVTATCSPGYTLYYGDCMCYKYDDSVFRSMYSASDYCRGDNGQVVKITSSGLNNFLVQLTGRTTCNGGYCPRIGLYCANSTVSGCIWPDGSTLSGYTNFYDGSIVVGPYYLNLDNSFSGQGTWNPEGDGNCATICQKSSTTFAELAKEREAKGLTAISPEEHYKNNFKH